MRLSNMTWPQVETYFKSNDMVLISIGSIECHGRHMPLGTDTLIPDFLLDKIEQKSDVLICPTIPYGATESLCDYPGTINLGTELLYQVLGRVCDSLFQHGARRFVILNGHGGNVKSIDRVGYDIQRKGGILAELNWWLMAWDMDPAWKGGHGGGEETAAILGIDPARTMAIGDSGNDIPMLRAAALGVAMGNATREVKDAADAVTASNMEDGAAIAIERYILGCSRPL